MPVIVFPRPTESAPPGVTPVPIMPQALVELDLGNLISGAILDDPLTATLEGTAFSPTDITGLVGWWDFSVIADLWQDTARTSAVTADGQTIKGVTDLSGLAHHPSEATNGPTYKTAILNGLSVARFDGTNDRLVVTFAKAQPLTIAMVAMVSTSGADDTLFDGSSANTLRIYRANGSSQLSIYSGGGFGSGQTLTIGTYYVFSAIFNGASSQVRQNGVGASGTAGAAAPGSATQIGIFGDGSSTPLHGDIGELLIYDVALSTADHNSIGQYLATKWGLTWTVI